jgi:hypothetical protein
MLRILLLGSLVLAACGGGTEPEPEPVSFVGTYALERLNGHMLPWTYGNDGYSETYLSGTLILNASGDFSERWPVIVTIDPQGGEDGSVEEHERAGEGQHRVDDGVLVLEYEHGTTARGQLAGDRLTLLPCEGDECGGWVRVYVRQ